MATSRRADLLLLSVVLFGFISLPASGQSESCTTSSVPLDRNYKEKKLLGTWISFRYYQSFKPAEYDHKLEIYKDSAGKLYYQETYTVDGTGPCVTDDAVEMVPGTEGEGSYVVFGAVKVRIMEVRKKYFVAFQCFAETDGVCTDMAVNIAYRAGKKPKNMDRVAAKYIPQACVDAATYAENIGTGCLESGGKGKGKGKGRGNK